MTPVIAKNNFGSKPAQHVDEPLHTVTTQHNRFALIAPHITKFRQGSVGHAVTDPLHTVTASSFIKRPGGAVPMGLVAAFLAKHYGGGPNGELTPGQDLRVPMPTITAVDHSALVYAFLTKYYGTSIGQDVRTPLGTITAQAEHFGVVTVTINGEKYRMVDIGMRMLQPRELFAAQGFPLDYRIAEFTKSVQVRLVGNSVPPGMAEVLVRANYQPLSYAAAGNG